MTFWASALEVADHFYATTVPLGCPFCGGIERCHYGCQNWDDGELLAFEHEHANRPPATESEAHIEWHLNAGIPVGTPGCPWDACHPVQEGRYLAAAS